MQCPKCKEIMEKVVYAEIEVERCTRCRGLFFDAMEAERLKKLRGSEAIDVGDADLGKQYNERDRIRCPRDTTPMVRVVDPKQPHIWTETCPVCFGSFFDAGEFRDFKHETFGDVLKSWFVRERS
jgi:uncharacterized protein